MMKIVQINTRIMKNVWLIFEREYSTRIRNKWFWISTILVPLGIISLSIAPAILTQFSPESDFTLQINDPAEVLPQELPTSDLISVTQVSEDPDQLREDFSEQSNFDALALIPEDKGVTEITELPIIVNEPLSLVQETELNQYLSGIFSNLRIAEAELTPEQLTAISAPLQLKIQTPDAEETSSRIPFALGYGTGFLMYFLLIFFGSTIMRSIQEEKSSRVVEILISTVKPFELMMGKILGVLSLGLTQALFWFAIVMSSVPLLTRFAEDNDTTQALDIASSIIEEASNTINLFLVIPSFFVFFTLGMLLYASIFAMIAASADSQSDVQSLSGIAIIPIVIAFLLMFTVINSPESTFATVSSMIPFFSPLIMLARIPFGIPLWEIALSLVILIITTLFFIWIAAKIFRIGILLYGEKLSWRHLKTIWR
jgi:ABC-2 type transport system permease protein